MTTTRPLDTGRIPGIVPILNPLIRRLLGAGMPMGPNTLLTVRGRTSGLPRTFPVALIEEGGRRYVQSPFGEVNWVHNLRASGTAVLAKGRRREDVDARELPSDEAARVYRSAIGPYMRRRAGAAMVRWLFHLPAGATLDDLVAEAHNHPMFELRSR